MEAVALVVRGTYPFGTGCHPLQPELERHRFFWLYGAQYFIPWTSIKSMQPEMPWFFFFLALWRSLLYALDLNSQIDLRG